MMIFDDIFTWEGWGGELRLANGRCRLRIFDLKQSEQKKIAHLRPMVVIVSDVPKKNINDMSVRSCAGHIATSIVHRFDIDPNRMLYVEFYPEVTYGTHNEYRIAEKFEVVDFTWKEEKALNPRWRILNPPMLGIVKDLLLETESR